MRNSQKDFQHQIVKQVLELLGGRWRGAILASLCDSSKRFNELKRDLGKVTARTLTKELKWLEERQLLLREIENSRPIQIRYKLTRHGHSLDPLISQIVNWGLKHRKINAPILSGKLTS